MPFTAELVSPRTKTSEFDEIVRKLESLGKINKPREVGSTPADQLLENREAFLNELLQSSHHDRVTGHNDALSQPVSIRSFYGNDTLIRLTLDLRMGSDVNTVKPGQPSAMPVKSAPQQLVTEQRKATFDGNTVYNEVRKVNNGEVLAKLKDAILKKSKRADGLMVNLSLQVIRDMLSTQKKMNNARQLWMIGKK